MVRDPSWPRKVAEKNLTAGEIGRNGPFHCSDISNLARKFLQICGLDWYQGIYLEILLSYYLENVKKIGENYILGSTNICLGTTPNHIFGDIFLCL